MSETLYACRSHLGRVANQLRPGWGPYATGEIRLVRESHETCTCCAAIAEWTLTRVSEPA